MRATLSALLVASACLAGGAALAQSGPSSPSATGTGGGPASTATAPNTNSLGVTKPPSGASGAPTTEVDRQQLIDNQRINQSLQTGICKGCD